ncbi:hypothetical protein EDB80DRAFT_883087 [Ilyonectria destructans]|nr:hypothetical protein EDB80DRAFT_883087 [Ilyonectria destructans]
MQRFRELRYFTIDASGIEDEACNDGGGDGEVLRYNDSKEEDSDEENPINEDPTYEHPGEEESSNTLSRGHFIRFFVHAFPRSMEALVLFGDVVESHNIHFQRAVAAGIDAGVDVYTIMNRNKIRHVLFPEPLDEFDLVAGLYGGKRPDHGSWTFNAHTGRRESGCGNWGKCKACLEEYSEEPWEQVDGAARIAGESVGLDKEYDGSEY